MSKLFIAFEFIVRLLRILEKIIQISIGFIEKKRLEEIAKANHEAIKVRDPRVLEDALRGDLRGVREHSEDVTKSD